MGDQVDGEVSDTTLRSRRDEWIAAYLRRYASRRWATRTTSTTSSASSNSYTTR